MNRRGFLGAIGSALAGATLDPEKLLWRKTKTISSPSPPKIILPRIWLNPRQPPGTVDFINLKDWFRSPQYPYMPDFGPGAPSPDGNGVIFEYRFTPPHIVHRSQL